MERGIIPWLLACEALSESAVQLDVAKDIPGTASK
jgi:hypothetical protein